MYGEEDYTLAGTSTDAPDKWPENTDVITVLSDVRKFQTDKNGQKLTKLSVTFTTAPENGPKLGGKSKDSVHPITGASEDNKYWTQQFLMALKIPVEVIQSARGVDHLIQIISQYKGRKYLMKATSKGDYQNIVTASIRPYILPGTDAQATVQTAYGQPTPPPMAPAPAAAPVVDPWANTPNPAGQNFPQVPQQPQYPISANPTGFVPSVPQTAIPDPWANQGVPAAQNNPTVAAGAPENVAPQTYAPATPPAAPVETNNAPQVPTVLDRMSPEQHAQYQQFLAFQQAQQNQAPANTPQPTVAPQQPTTPSAPPQGGNVEDEAKSFLAGLEGNDLTSTI